MFFCINIRALSMQVAKKMLLFLLISNFWIMLLLRIEAAHHYCIQDSIKAFSMNADSDQPETLLTNHWEVNGLASSQRCSWEVRLGRMTQPLQLMLSLRLGHRRPSAAASGPGCPSELTAELQESVYATSLPEAPLIVPVMRSSQLLTVRFSTGDSEPSASCGRIELTIA
uniref:CUB domain-containing protein n=1 Tax=Macrostomum lignano TaxID=282301 RepID=A0A1I8GVA6_9PLAT